MNKILGTLLVAIVCISAELVAAGEQTARLKVENMYCASCPFIVKKTLASVEGVKRVDVSFRQKTATVVYDDQKCTAAKLASAASDAGFPATPIKQ